MEAQDIGLAEGRASHADRWEARLLTGSSGPRDQIQAGVSCSNPKGNRQILNMGLYGQVWTAENGQGVVEMKQGAGSARSLESILEGKQLVGS